MSNDDHEAMLSIGEAGLRLAIRWARPVEEAKVALKRALQEHRLPVYLRQYAADLGIDLISSVDAQIHWDECEANPEVFIYAEHLDYWSELNSPSALKRPADARIPFRSNRWTRQQACVFWVWEDLGMVELVAPKDGDHDDTWTVEHLLAKQRKALQPPFYTERQWRPSKVFAETFPEPTGSIAEFERAVASGLLRANEFDTFAPDEVKQARRPVPVTAPGALATNDPVVGRDTVRAAPELKSPNDDRVHEAITAVYDECKMTGRKPPNTNEIGKPVLERLVADGYWTSKRRIQRLANDPRHNGRRGTTGVRFTKK